MRNIICLILITFFFGCNNEKRRIANAAPNQVESKKLIKDNLLKVIIDITISEDDRIQLFYVDDMPDGAFSAEKRIAHNVKGSNSAQKINFTLPHKPFPFKLRLDLGENNIQSAVKINSIELKYNSDSIFIENSVLEYFFHPNIYLEKVDSVYLRKTLNGRYDPFLVSTPLLEKKIELEF